MVGRNADGSLFVGEIVKETKLVKVEPIQEEAETDEEQLEFMPEPVEAPKPEPEKPRNKGGRPRKR